MRRAKEVSQSVRPNPDSIQVETAVKVTRLQRASGAFDVFGPEVDAIKKALKKASRGRTRTTRRRICQRVQGFHRAKAELQSETGLLKAGRARLSRLEAQQAASVGEPVAGSGTRTSTLQQMVIQWQVERDSLSQELRRSRAPKSKSWCGDGPPDVSAISSRCQILSKHQKLRVARHTRIQLSGRGCTFVASLVARSFTIGFNLSGSQCARSECDGSSRRSRDTDVCFDRCRGCQAQMFGWGALMSSEILMTRSRRCQVKCGVRGEKVDEAGSSRSEETRNWIRLSDETQVPQFLAVHTLSDGYGLIWRNHHILRRKGHVAWCLTVSQLVHQDVGRRCLQLCQRLQVS